MKFEPVVVARDKRPYWLLPLLVLLLLVALKPVPLVGGGTDDFKYLSAAHCVSCLPMEHWARRFPIVWPTALALQLPIPAFYSVMIAPLAAAIASLILLYALVKHQWSERAGVLAAFALATTPIFANRSMRIGVDEIELAFLLGSIFVIQRGKGHFWAGALLTLAVLCRPTQLASLPLVGLYAWHMRRDRMPLFALGLLLPLAAEAVVYWISTGSPLYPWLLSLHHAQHPSSMLSPTVDTTKSELFNPDFIGGWLPHARIDAPWYIRGFANFMVDPQCRYTMIAALGALALSRKVDRAQLAVLIASALFFGALTYAFAIDPRPRMFLPVLAGAAAIFGSAAERARPWSYAFAVPMAVIAFGGLTYRIDYRAEARQAAAILRTEPREIDQPTRERISLFYWNPPSTKGAKPLHVGAPCPEEQCIRP
jgi:4-amino-4-deoxy-L-arabinose transferase-like glycosyltransferase